MLKFEIELGQFQNRRSNPFVNYYTILAQLVSLKHFHSIPHDLVIVTPIYVGSVDDFNFLFFIDKNNFTRVRPSRQRSPGEKSHQENRGSFHGVAMSQKLLMNPVVLFTKLRSSQMSGDRCVDVSS